jgi:hypothetical protein
MKSWNAASLKFKLGIQSAQGCQVADKSQCRASAVCYVPNPSAFKYTQKHTDQNLQFKIFLCSECWKKLQLLETYRLVNLARFEKLDGIGPWKEFPWNRLKI